VRAISDGRAASLTVSETKSLVQSGQDLTLTAGRPFLSGAVDRKEKFSGGNQAAGGRRQKSVVAPKGGPKAAIEQRGVAYPEFAIDNQVKKGQVP
jgi:hypothetical protein